MTFLKYVFVTALAITAVVIAAIATSPTLLMMLVK